MKSHGTTDSGLRRGAVLLAAALAIPGFAGCGTGGSGGTSYPSNPAPLKVTSLLAVAPDPDDPDNPTKFLYFSAARSDNLSRNAHLEFRFSAPLAKNTKERLNDGTLAKAIQIGIVTANGRIPAKGSFRHPLERGEEVLSRLIFNPTQTKASDNLGCADNPFGFAPLTTYDIDIPAPPAAKKFLTSTGGDPIIESYGTFFTTSEKYVREVRPPRFVGTGGGGELGFDPPRFLNGEVPYNARVSLVFNEAMDPNTFELGTTITVKNETLSTLQGSTVLVPGTFSSDTCGQSWRFSPSFSYGGAGYDIAVILTTGMRDLAGNPLGNPQTVRFRTEVRAGVPTTQVISESFDTQTYLDALNTTADWGLTLAGTLQGGAVTTTNADVALTGTQYPGGIRTRVRDHPFADASRSGVGHDQWIYTQAELGAAGAITSVSWGPSSNALFASDHSRVQVKLGHTQGDALANAMDNNFDVGTPVKVADNNYVIPQRATIDPPCNTDACAVGYWPLPSFSNFFEYNGKNNVILDVDASLGTNYQITRVFFGPVGFPSRHTFCATGTSTGTLIEPLVTDMRFTKKVRTTLAQSRFYDSGQNNPNYSPAILSPSTQTGGTSMQVEFEGAEGILFPIPGNPNNVVPDPTTYTGFLTNLDQLDGYRFLRFRVTFVANVNTGAVPKVTSIAIPYIF